MVETGKFACLFNFTINNISNLFSIKGSLIKDNFEKKDHIKTLSDIGFSMVNLKQIFLYQGLILSFGGAVLGLILGMAITLLQQYFGWIKVFEDQPYPVVFKWENGLLVFVTLIVLGTIASYIAANRIKIIMKK